MKAYELYYEQRLGMECDVNHNINISLQIDNDMIY